MLLLLTALGSGVSVVTLPGTACVDALMREPRQYTIAFGGHAARPRKTKPAGVRSLADEHCDYSGQLTVRAM